MDAKRLLREQLDNKMSQFAHLKDFKSPSNGWVHSIRRGINMSLKQLGKRLSITPQSVKELEEREKSGSITLKRLREAAAAMDMELIYGFVPKSGSLEAMIEIRAREIAKLIVDRTSVQMELENQTNSPERLKKAIDWKTDELIKETPRFLWD